MLGPEFKARLVSRRGHPAVQTAATPWRTSDGPTSGKHRRKVTGGVISTAAMAGDPAKTVATRSDPGRVMAGTREWYRHLDVASKGPTVSKVGVAGTP